MPWIKRQMSFYDCLFMSEDDTTMIQKQIPFEKQHFKTEGFIMFGAMEIDKQNLDVHKRHFSPHLVQV